MVFYHNINPILFSLGPFSIRYYGLFYALGVLLVYLTLIFVSKKKFVKNLNEKNVETIFLFIILSTLIGARLGYVLFYGFSYYFSHPLEIFSVWKGGLSFFGALIGVSFAMKYICKKYKISFFEIADILVIPVAFSLFLGRIGNFINSEIIGTKTNSSLCVVYEGVDGCRYPVQLYESFKNLFISSILFLMYYSKKYYRGVVFFSFLLLYGILRFLTNFYRDEPRFFGITQGQYFALILFIISVVWFVINRHKIFK